MGPSLLASQFTGAMDRILGLFFGLCVIFGRFLAQNLLPPLFFSLFKADWAIMVTMT